MKLLPYSYGRLLIITMLSNLFCLQSAVVHAQKADPHARDLVLISRWFEGHFDNDEQIWFENDRRWTGTEADKHRRNHATHQRVNAEQFGEHVFFVEEYIDDNPEDIWRRRLIILDSDEKRGLQMKIYFFENKSLFKDKKINPETIISGLSTDAVTRLPECDVWIVRNGEQFEGEMDYQACAFGKGKKRRYSEHSFVLSKNQYWRVDKTWLFSNGEQHAGEKAKEPQKMRRAHMYRCEVKMPYKSYAEPHAKDVALKDLMVHSQGGTALFTNPKTGKQFKLQLRDKEYPYYKEGSDFFLLRIKEVGAKYSTALVTTGSNPGKIAVNMGKLLASCKRDVN